MGRPFDLTRRQEAFIRTLVDLYSETEEPIHYPKLAERLGVSPFTAYDMLRLLEERGYARCEYQVAEGKRQPGRSIVIFAPTTKAHQLMASLRADVPEGDWERVKDVLVALLRSGGFEDHELALDVLARVPQGDSPVLRYCTEVATVLMFRLWRAGRLAKARPYLRPYLPPDDAGTGQPDHAGTGRPPCRNRAARRGRDRAAGRGRKRPRRRRGRRRGRRRRRRRGRARRGAGAGSGGTAKGDAPDVRADLLLLAGFAVGALAAGDEGPEAHGSSSDAAWADEVARHTRTYLLYVSRMDAATCTRLAEDLAAVLRPLLERSDAGGAPGDGG